MTHGEPIGEYHSDHPCLGSSQLRDYLTCPRLFWTRHCTTAEPYKSSPAMDKGTLVHSMLESLDPAGWFSRCEIIPDGHITASGALSTKADTKAWLTDRDQEKTWLTPEDDAFLSAVLAEFSLNTAAKSLLESVSRTEVSIRWTRDSGDALRCRPDALTEDGQVIDWKTTRYERPVEQWHKSCADFLYHVSDALYSEGTELAGLKDADLPLVYVLISTSARPTVQCVRMPPPLRSLGKQLLEKALQEIAVRKSFGGWEPAHYGSIVDLPVPAWVLRSEKE